MTSFVEFIRNGCYILSMFFVHVLRSHLFFYSLLVFRNTLIGFLEGGTILSLSVLWKTLWRRRLFSFLKRMVEFTSKAIWAWCFLCRASNYKFKFFNSYIANIVICFFPLLKNWDVIDIILVSGVHDLVFVYIENDHNKRSLTFILLLEGALTGLSFKVSISSKLFNLLFIIVF